MVKAYVLIEVKAGHSGDVAKTLSANDNVAVATRVTGPYDVIAEVWEEDLNALHALITERLHHLPGVIRTTTSVSVG